MSTLTLGLSIRSNLEFRRNASALPAHALSLLTDEPAVSLHLGISAVKAEEPQVRISEIAGAGRLAIFVWKYRVTNALHITCWNSQDGFIGHSTTFGRLR